MVMSRHVIPWPLGGRRGTLMDALAARLLHFVLFSAMGFRAEAPFCVHCVTFSIHELRGCPHLLTPPTVPCRILFARKLCRVMWPNQFILRLLTMLACEFINLSSDIFAYFPFPVRYSKVFLCKRFSFIKSFPRMCFEGKWLQNGLQADKNDLRSILAVDIQGHQCGGFCIDINVAVSALSPVLC